METILGQKIEVEHKSGTKLEVYLTDIDAAHVAYITQTPLVITRPMYVIEIPRDPEMDDPTSLILDGEDYIHLV